MSFGEETFVTGAQGVGWTLPCQPLKPLRHGLCVSLERQINWLLAYVWIVSGYPAPSSSVHSAALPHINPGSNKNGTDPNTLVYPVTIRTAWKHQTQLHVMRTSGLRFTMSLPGSKVETGKFWSRRADPPSTSHDPSAPPLWGDQRKDPKPQPEMGHPWPRGCLSVSGFLGTLSNSVPPGGPGERASQMNSMQTCDD